MNQRAAGWAAVGILAAAILLGVRLNWAAYAAGFAVAAAYLVLVEYEAGNRDPRRIALTGVLVAFTAASRQLIHGVEFTPVFALTIAAGRVFGFTTGFAVGSLTMLTSNFFIGHGPWTPFQMLGLGLTGAFAALLPKTRHETAVLAAYSVAAAYAYGLLTDAFSWIAFVPVHTPATFIAVASAGMPANTMRAVGNVFFTWLLTPFLVKAYARFRKRLG